MKPGRNDPCPCGSGKKYKHCCLAVAQTALDASDLNWRRIRRALEGYGARLLTFVAEAYGAVAVPEAWEEFNLDDAAAFDPHSDQMPLFMPWMFHCWSPQASSTDVADPALHGVAPAEAFLQRNKNSLEPLLREYLESCAGTPFSFYETERCAPGQGMSLRDVLTGEAHEVQERSASKMVQAGDLLYGQLAKACGLTLLEASAPLVIPPIHKLEIIELRQRMQRRHKKKPRSPRETLCAWDIELRQLYLDIREQLVNPAPPRLRTTDGEEFVLQNLVYDIESAQAAFDALKHLDFEAEEGDEPEGAEHSADGELKRALITWKKPGNAKHASWSNTILGNIEIDRRRLTVQVNSKERAKAFKKIIEQALGARARYRVTESQSIEKMLSQPPPPDAAERAAEQRELQELPEVKAALNKHMAAHYDDWPTRKLPVLGGRTPLACVKTADGREKVEALLRDLERRSAGMPSIDPAILHKLRERLGLPGKPKDG